MLAAHAACCTPCTELNRIVEPFSQVGQGVPCCHPPPLKLLSTVLSPDESLATACPPSSKINVYSMCRACVSSGQAVMGVMVARLQSSYPRALTLNL